MVRTDGPAPLAGLLPAHTWRRGQGQGLAGTRHRARPTTAPGQSARQCIGSAAPLRRLRAVDFGSLTRQPQTSPPRDAAAWFARFWRNRVLFPPLQDTNKSSHRRPGRHQISSISNLQLWASTLQLRCFLQRLVFAGYGYFRWFRAGGWRGLQRRPDHQQHHRNQGQRL